METTKTNTTLGLVTGLAVGAVLGMLFAPQKGTKTRKKIADQSRKGVANLKANINSLATTATDKAQEISDSVASKAHELELKGKVAELKAKNKAEELEAKGRELLNKPPHSV